MAVKRYDGSQWVTVAGKGDQGTSSSIATWVKTASGGETSVSGNDDNSQPLSYTVGQELVFINGALQKRGSDYTATTGNSITGLTALAANDVVTVWTVNAFSVTGAIANSLVDAKGDLIVATGADTPGILAVGTANQVLTVDSSTGTGLKWATPAAGGMTSIASGSLSGSTTTIDNISGSYNNLMLFVRDYSSNDDTGDLTIRFNNDTTSNRHLLVYQQCEVGASYADGQSVGTSYFTCTGAAKAADNNNSLVLTVFDYATSGIRKNAEFINSVVAGGGSAAYVFKAECGFQGDSAITRIDLLLDAGSFDGGTYVLYGVK
jgi:hypothetical protein